MTISLFFEPYERAAKLNGFILWRTRTSRGDLITMDRHYATLLPPKLTHSHTAEKWTQDSVENCVDELTSSLCVCVSTPPGGKTTVVGLQPLSYYRTDEEKIDVRRRGLTVVTRLAKKQLLHTHTPRLWRGVAKKKRPREKQILLSHTHTHEDEVKQLYF